MISERLSNAINNQINKEFYSAYLYLSMSDYFAKEDLFGFSHWAKLQAKEEMLHGMKIIDYMHNRNANIEFMAINKPEVNFKNAVEAFKIANSHEKHVADLIENIALIAEEENDRLTLNLTNHFLQEQLEEELHIRKILSDFKHLADSSNKLFLIDKKLSKRR